MHLPKCTIPKFLTVCHIEIQTSPTYDGARMANLAPIGRLDNSVFTIIFIFWV